MGNNTKEEYLGIERHVRNELMRYRLGVRAMLVCERVIQFSWQQEQDAATLTPEQLAALTALQLNHVHVALRQLERAGVLWRDRGTETLCLVRDSRQWRFSPSLQRLTIEEAAAIAEEIRRDPRQIVSPHLDTEPPLSHLLAVADFSPGSGLIGAGPESGRGAANRGLPSCPDDPSPEPGPFTRVPETTSLHGLTRKPEGLEATRVGAPESGPTDDEAYQLQCLMKLLGRVEMARNGGLWRVRLRESRRAMYEATCALKDKLQRIEQGALDRRTGKPERIETSPASWLTKAYHNARKQFQRDPGTAGPVQQPNNQRRKEAAFTTTASPSRPTTAQPRGTARP